MFKPIVIIGAPRSGTNMLRDILTKTDDIGTWPCDEINYIWRHGNIRYPSDRFLPEMAIADVRAYIQKQFQALATMQNVGHVLEKTCANSLRVGFVDAVLSDAKYIFIVRDGRDVVASAIKRWKAQLDIPYVLRKARYVPVSDLPYYASRYFFNHVYRLFTSKKRLAFWGPQLDNMESLLKKYSLDEVCAIQWQECVNFAEKDFSLISSDRIHRLQYEEFVKDPQNELIKIFHFLGIPVAEKIILSMSSAVSKNSVGKWKKELDEELVGKLEPLINGTLQRYGYL